MGVSPFIQEGVQALGVQKLCDALNRGFIFAVMG
jgi:hypothetical protein